MEKKISNDHAVALFAMLRDARISRLSADARAAIIRNARVLRHIAEDFDDLRQEALRRLAPESADEMAQKNFRAEFDKIVSQFLDESSSVEITHLDNKQIDALCDNNDFTTSQIMLLEDILSE